jgi:hypothetical protein
MTRQYMPVLVPHPCSGALRAIGQVTGTEYIITETGTWVWEEDLAGLLSERRPVCPKHPLPVQCFFEASASKAQSEPYRPWPGKHPASGQTRDTVASPIVDKAPGLGSHSGGDADLPLELEEPEEAQPKDKKPKKGTARAPAKEDDGG